MKFPYHLERVRIEIVTGWVEMDKIVSVFQCRLMDEDGDLNFFFAVGVDEIVKEIGCDLNSLQLKLLFPETKDVSRMRVTGRQVDYLVGMEHASWQLTRVARAEYGGDFWTW